jgi:hypothetical protein
VKEFIQKEVRGRESARARDREFIRVYQSDKEKRGATKGERVDEGGEGGGRGGKMLVCVPHVHCRCAIAKVSVARLSLPTPLSSQVFGVQPKTDDEWRGAYKFDKSHRFDDGYYH